MNKPIRSHVKRMYVKRPQKLLFIFGRQMDSSNGREITS